jgi:hypothetical protein
MSQSQRLREEGSLDWNYIQEASKRSGYEALSTSFVLKKGASKVRHQRRRYVALEKFQQEFNNGYTLIPLEPVVFDGQAGWKASHQRWLALPEDKKEELLEADKVYFDTH